MPAVNTLDIDTLLFLEKIVLALGILEELNHIHCCYAEQLLRNFFLRTLVIVDRGVFRFLPSKSVLKKFLTD